MQIFWMLIKLIILFALLFGLYVAGAIIMATITDYRPDRTIAIDLVGETTQGTPDDTLVFYNWNIGYGGLGAAADFFYDGGNMVRSPKKMVMHYTEGIMKTISGWTDADIIFLQEVDKRSKRSYGLNQVAAAQHALDGFAGAYAINYNVMFVPIPFTRPMGGVEGGLVTLLRYKPSENIRHQYPSRFPWPKQLFFLNRCNLLTRYALASGKELVVINTHNSAYDDTGKLKAAEMDYLRKLLLEEYEKGNYVIVGGDWNQCPPDYDPYQTMSKEAADYEQTNIAADFMPGGWAWSYDPAVATNRKVSAPYQAGKTYTTIIDFYLLSPNVELLEVQGIDLDFAYSDHQPVRMRIKLKD
jgi:endonuclease/exonuclease/phosphatase family metal-dependent hydrolase